MGVDITAYNNLRLVRDHNRAAAGAWCEAEDHILAFAYSDFPRSMDGLAGADQVFDVSNSGTKSIGGFCYEVTDATLSDNWSNGRYPGVDVMGMSYSGYNLWRRTLAVAVTGMTPDEIWDHPTPAECPFYDLIHFADNEGTIGPAAAARLHADFTTPRYREAFEAACPAEGREWWMKSWDGWVRGTAVAMRDGLVDFH